MSEILRLSKSPAASEAEAGNTATSALIPLIVRNARDLIAFLDVDGRRIYNSPSYAPLLGDPDALVGTDSFADIHPEDRERVRAVFRDTVRSGNGYRVEYRLVARDGTARVVQSEGSVIRVDDGRVVGVVVVGRDVTDERDSKSQLDAALRRQTALADFSLYALRASDPMQVIERAARLAAEALNVDFCTVLELEPDGSTMRVVAGHNWPQQRLGARLSADEDVQARQALERYRQSGSKAIEAPPPVITYDLQADARFAGSFRVREMGIVSAVCVAIPAGEQPYGTLSAHSRTRRRFEPIETEFMQAIANVLSAALVNFKAQDALRRQTERLTIAQRGARMIVLDWGIQADRLEFSDSPAWLRGPRPESGKYPLFKDQVHPEDHAQFLAARQRAIETLRPETLEFRVVRTDGEVLWVRSHQTPVAGADGKATRMIAAVYDITEHKAAQQALADSESRFRSLAAMSSDWYWEQDAELRFRSVSEVFFHRSRLSREEVLGKRRWELAGGAPLNTTWDAHRVLLEARLPFRDFEYARVADDGSKQFVSLSGDPVFDADGRFTGYRGTGRDITERRRAEQELRARVEGDRALSELGLIGLREQNAGALLQNTIQIVGRTLGVDLAKALELLPDGSGLKLVAGTGWKPGLLGHATVGADLDSQAGYTIHEYEAAKRLGIEHFAPVIVADLDKEQRFHGPALLREHGVVSGMSVVIPGAERPWGVLGVHSRTPRRFEPREAEFLQAAANMLSAALARCAAYAASRESEARKSAILDASMDAVVTIDHLGRIVEFNASAERNFGWPREQAIGKDMAELIIPPELRKFHRKGLARFVSIGEGRVIGTRIELPALRADGSRFDVELAIVQIAGLDPPLFTGTARDITERKAAERLLALEHAVTRCLAGAETVRDALREVMRAICESQNWDNGRYFHHDEAAGVMRLQETWCEGSEAMQRFNDASRGVTFAPGAGLVGRAWQAGEPLWVADVTNDPRFELIALARDMGVHGALVLPVIFEGRTIGVLAILSRTVREPDPQLLRTMQGIGSQLGQFLQRKQAEEALAESERRYRILFDASPEPMFVFDRESLAILAVNGRMIEHYGWSREELLGMSILELRPPEERAQVVEDVRTTLGTRGWKRRRYWRKDGEVLEVEVTARVVNYGGRSAEMVIAVDISERLRMEQALREHRRLLGRAQELAGLGYWAYDPEAGVTGSRALRRMLGIGMELPPQGPKWSLDLVHPEDRDRVRDAVLESLEKASSYVLEARVLTTEGTPRIFMIAGEAVKDEAGRATKVIGSCLDVTEQRERENALSEAADQLQALSRRLVDAQETERRRLATELHDRVGQNLTALGINLDILARRLGGLDDDARHRLEESHSLIVATTRCVAGVLDDLHPPMLDDLGLGPTLRWAAQDFSRRTEIPTKVRVDGEERRIDRQNELALLRIVQEALTNVARHAGPCAVGITVVWYPEALQVEVADDGAGFECSGPHGATGLGIATMRERSLAVHGQLDLDSAPGRGTRVRVVVPG